MATYSIYSGDKKMINLSISLENEGESFDLNDYEVFYYIYCDINNPLVTKNLSNGITITSENTCSIILDSIDTIRLLGKYKHEVDIKINNDVYTVFQDDIILKSNVRTIIYN